MYILLTIACLVSIVQVNGLRTVFSFDDTTYNPCQTKASLFFYSHPTDSHKYYQCDEFGTAYLRSCGELVWDELSLTCNWPSTAVSSLSKIGRTVAASYWPTTTPSWFTTSSSWPPSKPSWLTASPSWPTTTPSWPSTTPSWPTATPSWLTASPSWPTTTPSWPSTTPSWFTASPSWPTTTPSWPSTTPSWPTATPSWLTASPSWPTTTPSWPSTTPSWFTASPSWPTTTPSWPSTTPSWPTATPSWLTASPSWPTTTPSWPSTTPSWFTASPSSRSTIPSWLTASPSWPSTTPSWPTTTPSWPTTTPSWFTASPSSPSTIPSWLTASPSSPSPSPSSPSIPSWPTTTPSWFTTSPSWPPSKPSWLTTSPSSPSTPSWPTTTPSWFTTSPSSPSTPSWPTTTPSWFTTSPSWPPSKPSWLTASPSTPSTSPSTPSTTPLWPPTKPSWLTESSSSPSTTPSWPPTTPSSPATTTSSSSTTTQSGSTVVVPPSKLCTPINPCGEHGECLESSTTVPTSFRRFACLCEENWFGQLCNNHIDELTTPSPMMADQSTNISQTTGSITLPAQIEQNSENIPFELEGSDLVDDTTQSSSTVVVPPSKLCTPINPCGEHGECLESSRTVPTSFRRFACLCEENWFGRLCNNHTDEATTSPPMMADQSTNISQTTGSITLPAEIEQNSKNIPFELEGSDIVDDTTQSSSTVVVPPSKLCAPINPCGEHGECLESSRTVPTSFRRFACLCEENWFGRLCNNHTDEATTSSPMMANQTTNISQTTGGITLPAEIQQNSKNIPFELEGSDIVDDTTQSSSTVVVPPSKLCTPINPCGEHGECLESSRTVPTSFRRFACICEKNWFGPLCNNHTDEATTSSPMTGNQTTNISQTTGSITLPAQIEQNSENIPFELEGSDLVDDTTQSSSTVVVPPSKLCAPINPCGEHGECLESSRTVPTSFRRFACICEENWFGPLCNNHTDEATTSSPMMGNQTTNISQTTGSITLPAEIEQNSKNIPFELEATDIVDDTTQSSSTVVVPPSRLCAPINPCGEHGECLESSRTVPTSFRRFACICEENWFGPLCDNHTDESTTSPPMMADQTRNISQTTGSITLPAQIQQNSKNIPFELEATDIVDDTTRSGSTVVVPPSKLCTPINPCGEHGECLESSRTVPTSFRRFACLCEENWFGRLCNNHTDEATTSSPMMGNQTTNISQTTGSTTLPAEIEQNSENISFELEGSDLVEDTTQSSSTVVVPPSRLCAPINPCGEHGECLESSRTVPTSFRRFACICEENWFGPLCDNHTDESTTSPPMMADQTRNISQTTGSITLPAQIQQNSKNIPFELEATDIVDDTTRSGSTVVVPPSKLCTPINPCGEHGECLESSRTVPTSFRRFACLCEENWSGRLCNNHTDEATTSSPMMGNQTTNISQTTGSITLPAEIEQNSENISFELEGSDLVEDTTQSSSTVVVPPSRLCAPINPCGEHGECLESSRTVPTSFRRFACICEENWFGPLCDNHTDESTTSPPMMADQTRNISQTTGSITLPAQIQQNSKNIPFELEATDIVDDTTRSGSTVVVPPSKLCTPINPCGEHGECLESSRTVPTSFRRFACLCEENWSGRLCNNHTDEATTSSPMMGNQTTNISQTTGSITLPAEIEQNSENISFELEGSDLVEDTTQSSSTVVVPPSKLCTPINPCGEHGECLESSRTVPTSFRRFACICEENWFGQLCDNHTDELTTPPPMMADQTTDNSETTDRITLPAQIEQNSKNITFELEASDIVERYNRTLQGSIPIIKPRN